MRHAEVAAGGDRRRCCPLMCLSHAAVLHSSARSQPSSLKACFGAGQDILIATDGRGELVVKLLEAYS